MKIGDVVIFIEDDHTKYLDDYYLNDLNFLIKNSKYKITNIHKDFEDDHNKYLSIKGFSRYLNSKRFISTQEYRKLKLKKLNENRRYNLLH